MTRKNRQLRPKNATSEAGLQATGHKRADHFRETQKVAIIRHKFGFIWGIPVYEAQLKRTMVIEGLQLCGRTDPKVLAVVLHGWGGGPATMKDVIDATKFAFGALGIDVYAPRLPYAFHSTSSIRAEAVIKHLLRGIDQIVAERACYERIIVVGYSLGALIARRLFLVAAGNPPGFVSEQALLCENPRPWASLVDRLVTLGAFNRGWQVSGRMGWYYSFLLNLVGLIGHLSPNDWRPTIFDMRLGAPFIVQTRLHWLAYRRWHQSLRRGQIAEDKLHELPLACT